MSQMDKRAHHNALERKRRDHIKDSFTGLRDAIPTMRGGDKSSRAQILKKASEYIQVLHTQNWKHEKYFVKKSIEISLFSICVGKIPSTKRI